MDSLSGDEVVLHQRIEITAMVEAMTSIRKIFHELAVAVVFLAAPSLAFAVGKGAPFEPEDRYAASRMARIVISGPGGARQCSGVWFEKNTVLSAAHCFFDGYNSMRDGRAVLIKDKSRISVIITSISGNSKLTVDRLVVNLKYDYEHPHNQGPGRASEDPNDIAVLFLNDKQGKLKVDPLILPTGEEPYEQRTSKFKPYEMFSLGYGPLDPSHGDWTKLGKFIGDNSPSLGNLGLLTNNYESEAGLHRAVVCKGDSGGGVFLGRRGRSHIDPLETYNADGDPVLPKKGGVPVLVGILSTTGDSNGGSVNCGHLAGFVRLDLLDDWLKQVGVK